MIYAKRNKGHAEESMLKNGSMKIQVFKKKREKKELAHILEKE